VITDEQLIWLAIAAVILFVAYCFLVY